MFKNFNKKVAKYKTALNDFTPVPEGGRRKEAEKIINQAKQSIDNEKRSAINEIKNQVANLSVDIASKVIDKEMDKDNNHEDYIAKLINDQK